MSTSTLERPGRTPDSLLSDDIYRRRTPRPPLTPRRTPAPSISMKASQPFTVPFGEGYFEFDDEPPIWFRSVLSKVCALGELSCNWNSYGARPICPETAVTTVQILLDVLSSNDPLPAVVPTSGGGILLEWHLRGVDLEIDVRSPTLVHVAFEVDGREEELENASIDQIRAKLDVLRGRT